MNPEKCSNFQPFDAREYYEKHRFLSFPMFKDMEYNSAHPKKECKVAFRPPV